MAQKERVGSVRRLQTRIAARESRKLGRLFAFDQVDLRLGSLETKRKFATIGQQRVLIERSVERCAEPLRLARCRIEPVEPSLHIAVLAFERTAGGIYGEVDPATIGRPADVGFDSLVVRDLAHVAASRCDEEDFVVRRVLNALVNRLGEKRDLSCHRAKEQSR